MQRFLKDYKIKSVLDAGCGDWQFSKLMDWSGINYIGIDAVGFLINENTKKYSRKNIKFYKKNFLKGSLPKTDLIIIKDVLQHLSDKNIKIFLPKLKKFKFAILVHDFSEKNIDCKNGDFRPISLKNPPYNLKAEQIFFFNNKQVLLTKN